jgi:hypothetical protein
MPVGSVERLVKEGKQLCDGGRCCHGEQYTLPSFAQAVLSPSAAPEASAMGRQIFSEGRLGLTALSADSERPRP